MLLVPGDGGRGQEARRAVASVGTANRNKRLFGPIHEVVPVAAVDVDVDEPRHQKGAAEVDRLAAGNRLIWAAHADDAVTVDDDCGSKRQAIGQDDDGVDKESRHSRWLPTRNS